MDVKFINAFLEGTVNVLKMMAFVDPKPGAPYVKKDRVASGDVSGIIGLTGAAKGSLALSFSEACILRIVSNMLGEEITTLSHDVSDAVGEITNMISGSARKILETGGLNVTAAIPSVVAGKNHSIIHVLAGPSIIIPFSIEAGSFVVDVCLTEK